MAGIRKPIFCQVDVNDKKLAEREAARRGITLQQLLTEWFEPKFQQLREKASKS